MRLETNVGDPLCMHTTSTSELASPIVVEGLTKYYGTVKAVDDLSFAVRAGTVTGFLGGEFGYAGQPEAFARKLREVLDDD